MKIVHQIVKNWTEKEVRVLREHGIEARKGLESIILDEDARYWQLKPLLDAWDAMDMVGTRFSGQDLECADYLMALPAWQTGYPQPEEKFGYRAITYDLANYCSACGMGAQQTGPFRLKKEPKWGKRKVFMLYWVLDAVFVRSDAYEKIFRPFGIDSRPVLLHRKETIIDSTVQLICPESTGALMLDDHEYEVCRMCRRKKYLPITRGFFPHFRGDSSQGDLFKSQEYWGSGASGDKWILLSQKLRQALKEADIRMSYVPMAG